MDRSMRHCHLLHSLLVTVLVAIVTGCGGGGGNNQSIDDISRNRLVWKSRAVSDYSFTFSKNAFVPPSDRGPVRITVRGGAVASIAPVETGQTINPEAFAAYNTIDKLFDTLETARDRKPALQQQKFNATFGYPESAYIDYSTQIADEEFGFEVTNFIPTAAIE